MSISKWRYTEECNGRPCPGDCDHCSFEPGDLIRRDDAIEAVQDHFNDNGFKGYNDGQKMMDRIKALPSADAVPLCDDCTKCTVKALNRPSAESEDRLYIKIYADDEPSVKAEKLYQICGETQNREVTKWLKEYFPSADAVQGDWIEVEDDYGGIYWECSNCEDAFFLEVGTPKDNNYNFCPSCGARMKGGAE